MKPFWTFVIPLLIILIGCQDDSVPVSARSSSESGNVAFTFDKANAPEAVRTLTAALSREGYDPFERTVDILSDTGATLLFERVAVGTWNVKIDARDNAGTVIYSGQSVVIVQENTVTQLTIVLQPVSTGVGSVQINVTWGTGKPVLFPKTFGGLQKDAAICVIQTADGGYAMGGVTYSHGTGGDAWFVKTNARGEQLWAKNFGAGGEDRINNIIQTGDGGFITVGYKHTSGEDSWIMKLDSSGTMLWEKNFGTTGDDAFLIVKRLADGNFLTCGYAYDGVYYNGQLVKFNAEGNLLWRKTYGGSGGDFAMNFVELPNSQIMVTGYNGSNFPKHYDFWLFKTDGNGSLLWEKMYGDTAEERSAGLVQLSNGTLLLSGYRAVNGNQDGYLMNIDTSGTLKWSKAYNSGSSDFLIRVQRGPDNLIVAAGYTSVGSTGMQGWMMKLDNTGTVKWTKTYGGIGYEVLSEIRCLSDGSIIGAGTGPSPQNGSDDFWLIKTDAGGTLQ
jgi:hypothetical protein